MGERRLSSWAAHQRRSPRSSEPGTDFYCPIGTPIVAPADGRIYGYGTSIIPATGRWVGIEFDNGMSFRAMHLSRLRRTKGFVRRGEVIGWSGASGYGDEDWSWNPNTGGAHVHVTLWPTHDRRFGYRLGGHPYTVDFMNYVDKSKPASGGNVKPAVKPAPIESEEDDMTIIIIQRKGNPDAPKGMMTHNRKMRLITKYENLGYRGAQKLGKDVAYVDVTDAQFDALLAGKD